MKYFIDTEFIEGKQIKRLFGLPLNTIISNGYNKPTIDLISIGMVAEDEREYSAISKEFNLKEAWNRYDLKDDNSVGARIGATSPKRKVYWLRENVLRPIFEELINTLAFWNGEPCYYKKVSGDLYYNDINYINFNYKNLKFLINKYGKSNKQIAEDIIKFTNVEFSYPDGIVKPNNKDIQFYGYYCDYDWVVFCWLFGKMIDLPEGFPMYCVDLKQSIDTIVNKMNSNWFEVEQENIFGIDNHKRIENPSFENKLKLIEQFKDYPKQVNEHNALSDAKWNKQLYEFLNKL